MSNHVALFLRRLGEARAETSRRDRVRASVRAAQRPRKRAATIAARWSRRRGFSPGNDLEAALVRVMLAEYDRIGPSPSTWALCEAIWCTRLHLELEP